MKPSLVLADLKKLVGHNGPYAVAFDTAHPPSQAAHIHQDEQPDNAAFRVALDTANMVGVEGGM